MKMISYGQVRIMKKWWIGCSGFYYKHWRDRFYPKGLPQSKWFEFYCEYFNTVELNVTFYRFPTLQALQGWFDRSPDDFRFTCKAPRLITHYKRFNDSKSLADNFYETIDKGLKSKLGTVLFQLHPRMEYSEENLQKILDTVDTSFSNVIECRHETWWNAKAKSVLKEHDISFCGISYPNLPDEVVKTSPVMYYRFHGVPQLYLSPYSETKLRIIAEKINSFRKVEDVYCYFNNDIEVAAIANARTLQDIAGSSRNVSSEAVMSKFRKPNHAQRGQ
jgi:uncharacterized protein YecE (DUF72 family)